MEERPRINIPLSATDRLIEYTGWGALIVIWSLSIYYFSSFPGTIPIHFNAAGEVDNYGSKSTLLILPVIATVLFGGLTVLNRSPHIFNYPVNIYADNALPHYTNATRAIRWLKTVIPVIFTVIVLLTGLTVEGKIKGPGMWLLPLILLPVLPVIYFAIRSFRIGK